MRILITCFFLMSLFFHSLTNDLQVIAIAGGFFQTSHNSLSWTMGEVTSQTLSRDHVVLAQGFQQGDIKDISSVEYGTIKVKEVNIYPNPTNRFLFVDGSEVGVKYRLVDILGQPVLSGEIKSQSEELDVQFLPQGVYLLIINNTESYKIIKY